MGRHSKQGFTIIETMLVLAVTGVLIASLLVGVGASIARQRYNDSVVTLKSHLQDQYARVDSVSNDRDATWTCGASATPAPGSVTGSVPGPGQSDCVLLGRYMSIVDGSVSMATVVGNEKATTAGLSDIDSVKSNYTLGISRSSIEDSSLEWGAKIAWPTSGSGARSPTMPRSIAILIIRSPDSGTTYTFTSDTVLNTTDITDANLRAMLVVGSNVPGQGSRTICVNPDGVVVPEMMAIAIGGAASGPGAIEIRSPAILTQAGSDVKC